jgi:hypothetical protein
MTQPVDFGTCWGTPNGQDLSMPSYMASGNLVVAEAVLRRWTTPQGQLIDDPDYGLDLTDSIGDDLSPSDLSQLQQQAAAEAEKDERVLSCQCVITLTVAGVLTVNATILTAAGPFKFVVTISAVTTTLLLSQ